MVNVKIEFRYAVLTSLVVLLWLITEYAVGLQDTYIFFHPYVSIVVAIVIPLITYRLAFIEKLEQKFGKLTFGQVFLSGFLKTMILYTSRHSKQTLEQAAMFFNLRSYIAESVLTTFLIGNMVSLILAFRMRTVN